MKKLLIVFAVLLYTASANAQNIYQALIKDAESKKALSGATVKILEIQLNAQSDANGRIYFSNIPAGKYNIQVSHLGYENFLQTLTFPLADTASHVILLKQEEEHEHVEEVVVSATRSSRTIYDIPTRVEVISGEELEEKANMKPGDIRMLLSESTGIQTQQTSASSANSAIRIQGLDGKYTQMIRDGFPLYSGFSGGLGLLQIAPLDLKQVEVIKGSSSTLYGGGAIAGLVSLVSKAPSDERELNFLLNGTSALGLDASMFFAERSDKTGFTLYGAYNKGTAYDPAGIGLTAIPKFDRYTLNPKLFVYFNDATTLSVGLNATREKRLGGDYDLVRGKSADPNLYFEKNETERYSSQVEISHRIDDNQKWVIRNAVSYYDRIIGLPNYTFSGHQVSTYTEANYSRNGEKSDWVAGINFLSDNFREKVINNTGLRDYKYHTIGAFAQNTWNASQIMTIETGVRGDYHNAYGFFFLPKLSALWKISDQFSTRLGGGWGYKAPTIFTEDAERIQFNNVLPLDQSKTEAEKSHGANFDINYKTSILGGNVGLSINHMFFYTRIKNPIILAPTGNSFSYIQPSGNLETQGMETNLKLTYNDFKLFVGYTLADVHQQNLSLRSAYPLVSKHRLNNVLMYEVEDQWKIGAEAYFFSKQRLNDGKIGKSYWTAGFMAEKIWERFSIFVNFENLTDTRQTRFDTIYTGSINNPLFRDIYAPVDGFVMNGGIKLKL